jgi:hypothetical protein
LRYHLFTFGESHVVVLGYVGITYKAPTLATAAAPATSAGTLPKRQSVVLCEYCTTNSKELSIGDLVKNSEIKN